MEKKIIKILMIILMLLSLIIVFPIRNVSADTSNRPPSNAIITGPRNGMKNIMYSYTAKSTDADNDMIQYTFTWGDPLSISQSSELIPNGTSFTANHNWTVAGRYDVTVTVTDTHTESISKITIYIDTVQTGDLGYLIDNNGDGLYDTFYSDLSKEKTTVQKKDNNYNIDSDGDDEWDHTYNSIEGLTSYQKPSGTAGFELIFVLCAIVVVMLLWRKKRIV